MIKSKIKESKQVEEQTFPRLMKFDDGEDVAVFLFTSEDTAMVIAVLEGTNFSVGEYDNCFEINDFKPFIGTIELTQD